MAGLAAMSLSRVRVICVWLASSTGTDRERASVCVWQYPGPVALVRDIVVVVVVIVAVVSVI